MCIDKYLSTVNEAMPSRGSSNSTVLRINYFARILEIFKEIYLSSSFWSKIYVHMQVPFYTTKSGSNIAQKIRIVKYSKNSRSTAAILATNIIYTYTHTL